MSQEITIVKQENIQTILSATPQSYQVNKSSRDKCIEFGQELLRAIQSQGGMTDDLDQQAASYVEKARRTVKKMNESRSPVTKLFDDIRKEFTAMENSIDPSKTDTIPYQLQQLRNQYAAKKRAEEEERRRKELARQQAEAARNKLRQDIEDDFKQQFTALVNKACNSLMGIDDGVTLQNYDLAYKTIKEAQTELPVSFITELHTVIRIPSGISIEEVRNVENEIKKRLLNQFTGQYNFEVDSTKQYILDRLPSKKANLERIAQSSAAEAERLKAEMEERKRKEDAEKEAERKRKEEEEKQKAEMERQQSEMNDLFNQQAAVQSSYQPKVKVAQKICLLNPEGIMPILSMWWSKEGCHLSVDELSKMFKKQITFCEKLANKEELYIKDESVEYIEDVKAK